MALPLVFAAYYLWYGTPETDGGRYLHWNHHILPHWTSTIRAQYPDARFIPPADIHAPFYPAAGLYSSRDAAVTAQHFADMVEHGIDVVVVSWWGRPEVTTGDSQGVSTDELLDVVLDAAARTGLKVALHLEPYEGRSAASFRDDVVYLARRYGSHPATLRLPRSNVAGGGNEHALPVYFVYDSYHIAAAEWAPLLTLGGSEGGDGASLRDTPADGVFIGLWLDQHHGSDLAAGGFDGAYTYFASDGFTYGSSTRNWAHMAVECVDRGLLFIPSVGPGYDDSKIRPWNSHNTRERRGGGYYADMWRAALATGTPYVGITSFNEWGEGTQIERAVCCGKAIDVDALAPLGLALNRSLRTSLRLADAYSSYGDVEGESEGLYMRLTAGFAAALKAGGDAHAVPPPPSTTPTRQVDGEL